MVEKTRDFENSTKVYLDHNATTPLAEEVISGLPLMARIWGNASSIHWAGRGPKTLMREARHAVAKALGEVSPLEIIFTSGGTESNNTVIRGLYDLSKNSNSHFNEKIKGRSEFITSTVEHPSILKTFKKLQEWGAIVHFVGVNRRGEIDLEQYQKLLSEKTLLVSIMLANNETGNIFPIQKMANMAHSVGALFHSDCVQALGKISLNLEKLGVDYASFSAHKVYALKGTGVLFVKKGSPLEPLIVGGGQERHRRGGTENPLGIWSLGLMAKSCCSEERSISILHPKIQSLRDYFENQVLQQISDVSLTGAESARLPNTSSLILKGVDGEILLMSLDLCGFAVSTGAACSSGNPEPSPVLLSMGLSRAEAQNSLRISLGWNTSKEQIDRFIEVLKSTVTRLRSMPPESMTIEKSRELNV